MIRLLGLVVGCLSFWPGIGGVCRFEQSAVCAFDGGDAGLQLIEPVAIESGEFIELTLKILRFGAGRSEAE
jgi:hypothetical protein